MPVNILIAEDERLISLDLKKSLSSLGYNIIGTASSADDAVEFADKLRPDIILMDVKFRGEISGFEAGYFINSHMNIPIIFVSGYSPKTFKNIYQKLNSFSYSYVPKPIDLSMLDKEIKNILKSSKINHY